MFEVGKTYQFEMMDGGSQISFSGEIEEYDHPLVKLADAEPIEFHIHGHGSDEPATVLSSIGPTPGRIINVPSAAFISAVRRDT